VTFVANPGPFVFARAINLGAKLMPAEATGLLIHGDDSVFCVIDPLTNLDALINPAPAHPIFGVIGAQVIGGVGNPEQNATIPADQVRRCTNLLCFVSVLIRRACWEQVGPLDERYEGYGFDDSDFCMSALKAGWQLGTTSAAVVRHGTAATSMHGTFAREFPMPELTRMYEANRKRFTEKWNISWPKAAGT
jgi:GT2 family glycosyltransferase